MQQYEPQVGWCTYIFLSRFSFVNISTFRPLQKSYTAWCFSTREFVFCSMSRCRSHKMKLIANYHFCILTHKINLINRWNWFGGKLNLKGRPALDKSQHVSRLLIVCPTFGSHVSSVNNSQLENGGGGGSHRKEWNSEGFIGTTRQFPPSEDQTLPQHPILIW